MVDNISFVVEVVHSFSGVGIAVQRVGGGLTGIIIGLLKGGEIIYHSRRPCPRAKRHGPRSNHTARGIVWKTDKL